MLALERVIAEIGKGEVVFPTHADVAIRVRLALDDADISMTRAAQLVEAEPLLASRVVALANSVLFNRGGADIADVRSAITRLGLRFVRALATAVVMRQMANGIRAAALRDLANRLWEHAVHVAALSRLLAGRFRPPLADTALFAGIVHEAGGFFLIARSDGQPDLFADGSLSRADAERRIGRAVLGALSVPRDVVEGIEAIWRPATPCPRPQTLGDLLVLAHRLTPIRSPLQADAPAAADAEPDPETAAELAGILEKSGEELDALTAVLRY